ncbi:Regulation of D-alanyl-lipoteichoic acid biosynthesis, DltR [Streptococcus sp. DD10]|uniref:response regulator transcription factor n=1 Tax=Streptococcus sp. DD10 TaxID=1777878 RepID=UPI00079AF149|nr:response regulator transcription factor [Streptococcus sp. DD10]KXT74420.1 Regulation of D-alanyl-lipoteichoic acid biosynthesis, DltR [Streptococcus sp. DD10]
MKILLAEDEKQLNRVITVALEREGYQVDSVENGLEAVKKAQENSYNLIILDIMMPIMTGIEALQEIRANGDTTYIIMLTAMSEVDDRVNGLDAGADDYLTKPFSLKELLARLRSMARRADSYTDVQLQLGNTALDLDEQEVRATNSIRLSNKELHLLKYFMKNPQKELSSQQLQELVWSQEETDTELVHIYISYLRQKLASIQSCLKIIGDKEGPFQLIETSGE